MALLSSWKRVVDVHQLAGRVMFLPWYPFCEEVLASAATLVGGKSLGIVFEYEISVLSEK